MNAVFADTFYFLALLHAGDEMHAKAEQFPVENYSKLVTTAWVLTELADGLAQTQGRQLLRSLLDDLESDPTAEVVLPDEDLWRRGIELYMRYQDKGWSLTDCISFIVMRESKITDALTADHHFEQAGFTILLK